jgi:glycosyltransferase involved in cell wall biosynthesis
MTGNQAPYQADNVIWVPVRYPMGYGNVEAMRRLLRLPGLFWSSWRSISRNDFVHARSPGHFGLVGALLARLRRRRSLTKWAGENGPYPGERLPSRIDRWLQGIPSARHPVLVYGPPRKPHEVEFLPALMTSAELDFARRLSEVRRFEPPWSILTVARLERVKGVDLAIRGLGQLRRNRPDLEWKLTIIGDGTERAALESLARTEGILERTRFLGALPFEAVQSHYASAHIAIMPGTLEGWPKVIAEAWAHGAVPVAAAAGLVPWILRDPDSGVAFKPSAAGLADAIDALLGDPGRLKRIADGSPARAAKLSLEAFSARLAEVLEKRCGL